VSSSNASAFSICLAAAFRTATTAAASRRARRALSFGCVNVTVVVAASVSAGAGATWKRGVRLMKPENTFRLLPWDWHSFMLCPLFLGSTTALAPGVELELELLVIQTNMTQKP